MNERIYRGIIIEITATHYGYRNTLTKRCGAGYIRTARTSLWATVRGPRGGEYQVWLGKRAGLPGVPVEKQEQDLENEMQHLVGQEVEFTQAGRRRNYTCFATKDYCDP